MMMWTLPDTLLFCLLACQIGMTILALTYLRGRALSKISFLMLGLVAVFIPLVGPFTVIAVRPGEPS